MNAQAQAQGNLEAVKPMADAASGNKPVSEANNQSIVPAVKPATDKTEPKEPKQDEVQPIPVPSINDRLEAGLKLECRIPDIFTPNGDFDNEKFVVELLNAKLNRITIYDYSGNMVFQTTDPGQYWDGKDLRSGLDCEVGKYTYSIDYQLNNSKSVKNKIGFIYISR